jgi:hypothetical protein
MYHMYNGVKMEVAECYQAIVARPHDVQLFAEWLEERQCHPDVMECVVSLLLAQQRSIFGCQDEEYELTQHLRSIQAIIKSYVERNKKRTRMYTDEDAHLEPARKIIRV